MLPSLSESLVVRATPRHCQTRRVARDRRMLEDSDFRARALTLNQDYLRVRQQILPEKGAREFAKVLPDIFVNSELSLSGQEFFAGCETSI